MKNNKGFVITEVLILSTVIIGILIFMYSQFKNINRSYQHSFKYDTVEGMYLANNMINYINQGSYDTLVQKLDEAEQKYLDITECDVNYFSTPIYCDRLFEASEVEQVIFTKEDLKELKNDMGDLPNDLKEYINLIKTSNAFNDYRIIIKYQDGTFATMRFNKGDRYVQKGLIVHLDAINNTGEGHSNSIMNWVDLSGHDNNGTLYNNPTWNSNSIQLDGQTNYVKVENTANMDFASGITVEVRFYNNDLKGEIFSNWNNDGIEASANPITNRLLFTLTIIDNELVQNDYWLIDENPIGLNTITITYDNNEIKYYKNGAFIKSVAVEGRLVPVVTPFALGGNPALTGMDSYVKSEIQNLRIYDRALTNTEIEKNYNVDISRY